MDLKGKKITLHDMTLRDGMHPKRHLMTLDQMKSIAMGLDDAGIPLIEVTHGDGLGGSSVNYGFPAHTDEEYLGTVIPLMKQAKVSVLLIPGLGTMRELQSAYNAGARSVHVATHCTEADTSPQHIAFARKLGMDTTGFLMMAHLNDPQGLAQQAKLMESYGAQTVYITDSAGYMLPADVAARVRALREVQLPAFAEQIALAKGHGLSLVIHTRDAWQDTYDVLDAEGIFGQVAQVHVDTAEVILITDAEHAIPVQSNRSGLRTKASDWIVSADAQPIAEVLEDVMVRMDARMKHEHALGGVETGFTDLDTKTSGFQPGDLVILAARPSMGRRSAASLMYQRTGKVRLPRTRLTVADPLSSG